MAEEITMGFREEISLTAKSLKKKYAAHQIRQEKSRKRNIIKAERQAELAEARARRNKAIAIEHEQKARAQKARVASSPFAFLIPKPLPKRKHKGNWLQDI